MELSNFQSRFNFVGALALPKSDAKRPFFKEFTGGKNGKTKMASLNFGIKESESNMAFVEAFDSIQDNIQTMDTDNKKIEIAWADRFDEDVVKAVANYKKYTVDLGEDCGGRKDFIAQYDAIQHLHEWLPKYKGKIVVTGQMAKEWYKDKYFDKFKVQSVYVGEDDRKNRLSLVIDAFYNKDCIDKVDFKEDKKIYINGYVLQYINKDEKSKYIPHQFIFNASKYDLENNEKHKSLFDYKMQYIDVKSKTMVHIPWELVLVRGAEDLDFDASMLTEKQKQQVELGIKTVEEFKPRGQIFGDKINEYRLYDPQLKGDFADGLVDTAIKADEFEEMIYSPPKDEKLADVVKAAEKAEAQSEGKAEPTVDDEDLF